MKQFEIDAQRRASFTKAAVKQLRKDVLVPCVIYGNKKENEHFTVIEKDLKNLIYTPGSYIVALNIEGTKQLCVLHEAQFHPVTDKILHLDFLAVKPGEPVTIHIPVVITGTSEGVRQGGKLQVITRKLLVKGTLEHLPDTLDIDITNLPLGKSVVAGDLKYKDIQIISPKATIICMVKMTRAATAAAAQPTE